MSTGMKLNLPLAAIAMMATLAIASPAFAQADSTTAAPPATTAPAATTAPGADQSGAATATTPGAADQAAPGTAAPDAAGMPPAGAAPTVEAPLQSSTTQVKENPYGLGPMWKNGDWVLRTTLIILGIMAAGSWYIFITKLLSQSKLISQSNTVRSRFYSANSLDEGVSRLERRSAFRSLAEDGKAAAAHHSEVSSQIGLSDWVATALNRSLDDLNSQLQGGNAFLATVASAAPFVGLFGTVWGILRALLNIGLSGQPSIDKVAGPVGEALISTAIGLAVAVPAVFFYNIVIRRNKVITDRLRSFAADVESLLLGATPAGAEAERGGRRR